MNDLYLELENIWTRHLAGERPNTEKDIRALLDSQSIQLRQDDGELRQVTVSKPTSVTNGFVVGLRYVKRDGTQTEDHFSVEKGRTIERHYKGTLERKWPEYRGTHKQQVLFTPSVQPLVTPISNISPISVNTISLVTDTVALKKSS